MKVQQFYILGNPRSGTSLLRLILNSHSQITVPPECGFLLWLEPKYKSWNATNLNAIDINAFVQDVQQSKKFETWNVSSQTIINSIEEEQPVNYAALAQCVYRSYASLEGKNPLFIGDKNNYYIHHLQELDAIIPNSFAIHLIRDGRDIVHSYREINKISNTYKYKPNLPFSIAEIAQQWQTNNLNINSFYKENLNYIVVRYEDLLENPEGVLSKILDKFNLSYEDKMLEFYKENALKQIEPKETLAWKLKTLKPLDKNNVGIYREKLTALEIKEFNTIAGSSLKLFGYDA
ncbi:sulfotransferase family protein [Lacinutrix sp. MEBiC02595]